MLTLAEFITLWHFPRLDYVCIKLVVNMGLLDIRTELAVPLSGQQVVEIVLSGCLDLHQPGFAAFSLFI